MDLTLLFLSIKLFEFESLVYDILPEVHPTTAIDDDAIGLEKLS